MKDEILNNITMVDIINKYGINHNRRKMSCPFHGHDKHPSAQIYDKYFHCFTCGKHLDVIGFVQELFGISFREAMQKINEDFDLGLNLKTKIDYRKIKKIENERKANIRLYNKLEKDFLELCDLKFQYINKIREINRNVNIYNWEDLIFEKSKLKDKIELIEIQLDFLIDEMYNFKRTNLF